LSEKLSVCEYKFSLNPQSTNVANGLTNPCKFRSGCRHKNYHVGYVIQSVTIFSFCYRMYRS